MSIYILLKASTRSRSKGMIYTGLEETEEMFVRRLYKTKYIERAKHHLYYVVKISVDSSLVWWKDKVAIFKKSDFEEVMHFCLRSDVLSTYNLDHNGRFPDPPLCLAGKWQDVDMYRIGRLSQRDDSKTARELFPTYTHYSKKAEGSTVLDINVTGEYRNLSKSGLERSMLLLRKRVWKHFPLDIFKMLWNMVMFDHDNTHSYELGNPVGKVFRCTEKIPTKVYFEDPKNKYNMWIDAKCYLSGKTIHKSLFTRSNITERKVDVKVTIGNKTDLPGEVIIEVRNGQMMKFKHERFIRRPTHMTIEKLFEVPKHLTEFDIAIFNHW